MSSPIETALGQRNIPDCVMRLISRQRSSLAATTSLRVLLIGACLALVFSLAISAIARQQESRRLVGNISEVLSTVEATARIACFTEDKTLAAELANGLLANRAIASVRILSGTTLLAEADRHGKDVAAHDRTDATIVHRKVSSPFNEGQAVGEISLVADDRYIAEQAESYANLLVSVSLIEILLIALVVGWIVLRVIVRPIRKLSAALRHMDVETGNHVVAPAGHEHDEVGHLTYVFNNLLGHSFLLLRNEKELRTQLAHKESRFRELAENSPNLIVRYDERFERIYCNPAFYEQYEIEAVDVLHKTPVQLWRPTNMDACAYQAILRSVLETGTPGHAVLEWNRADGTQITNDFHLVPEWDADGRVSSLLAIGHDISSIRRQQQLEMDRSLVFERLVRGGEIAEVLRMVAEHVEKSVAAGRCAILLLDDETRRMQVAAAPRLPEAYCDALNRFALGFPLGDDLQSYWSGFAIHAARHGLKVRWYEVILDSADRLLGVLVLYQQSAEPQLEADANFMRQACSLAALAIERKHIEDLAHHHASYDALTELPNRRMFNDRLRQEIARANRVDGSVTLLFIDLDRFKGVNDTLGHEVGDLLLKQAAQRISVCVRASDVVARLGGDEFVVILPEVDDITQLGRVANDIVDVISEPFEVGGHTAYVSASIGIASYPGDTDSAEKLVSCADQAMYAAKEGGRSAFRFYSAELSVSANERLALEFDLRQGIARGELELYFQPKVILSNGSLLGSEALLRWNHPHRGLVPPDKFIGIAEDSGLIMEMGEWVMHAACRAACDWNGEGKPLHKVAINLSARQFQSADLHQRMSSILGETRCQPGWIELEITESLLLEEGGSVLETLNSFRQMGITIAIDDFGTGYSALSYLARFPINTLKIDRSFVSNVTEDGYHAELVRAIISIANCLKQQVVAEGVETQEQANLLAELGCMVAQGYHYSEPLPKRMFEEHFFQFADTAAIG